MNSTVLESKKLRPEIIHRIETMDDESLLLLHRILLHLEKERLWRELSAEAEADRLSGKLNRLPEIIREALPTPWYRPWRSIILFTLFLMPGLSDR